MSNQHKGKHLLRERDIAQEIALINSVDTETIEKITLQAAADGKETQRSSTKHRGMLNGKRKAAAIVIIVIFTAVLVACTSLGKLIFEYFTGHDKVESVTEQPLESAVVDVWFMPQGYREDLAQRTDEKYVYNSVYLNEQGQRISVYFDCGMTVETNIDNENLTQKNVIAMENGNTCYFYQSTGTSELFAMVQTEHGIVQVTGEVSETEFLKMVESISLHEKEGD